MRICSIFLIGFLFAPSWSAHSADLFNFTIETKYCGSFNVRSFKCTDTNSWIDSVCYDSKKDLAILNLQGIGYCYCGMGTKMYQEFLKSDDLGVFYNARIKGHFGCRGIDSRFR